jgi:hypothetical protein
VLTVVRSGGPAERYTLVRDTNYAIDIQSDGRSRVIFRLDSVLPGTGQVLIGDLFDSDAVRSGATTLQLVYRARVLDAYRVAPPDADGEPRAPGGQPGLNESDPLVNVVYIKGSLMDASLDPQAPGLQFEYEYSRSDSALARGAVTIDVTDVSFRTEINFVHKPEAKGIQNYQVRLNPDEREIFKENNSWDFKVAVTDDRTNVLLVDGFPRWEFRYLRNLFYGRDKSVHLQYVLLNPDEIHRGPQPVTVYASASRPFGEAEATFLPQIHSEWQRFDVIILGDIPPNALSASDLAAIEEAVTKRGALLVCVAGPRYMPHGHDSRVLQDLLPVAYTPGSATRYDTPESAYRIQLTATGREHAVTSQSTSRALNEELWANFPPMRWRYSGAKLKDTAEVLAYAQPVGGAPTVAGFNPDGSPGSVEAAIQQLANQKNVEADNAIVSTIRAGLGKVLLLHFDQTWRFRYGVGDTYHHRFWGQVTRWGAGPNLRSGNDFVRMGTDRLSYTPNDAIEVTAKVLDPERRPVTNAGVEVEVWKDGERLRTQRLSYRTDSSGLYETSLSGLDAEGEYELKLVGDEVDEALAAVPEGPKEISTELLVVTTRNPVELAELTADRDFLNRATTMTGGKLAELDYLASLVNSFGAPKEVLKERRNITLWDKWPLMLAFFGLLTTEWVTRRRSGLV